MAEKTSELNAIKQELIALKDTATKDRVKNLLQKEINNIDSELKEIQLKQLAKDEAPKAPTKITVDIKEHAFDESDKFVKLFIPFDASQLKDEDVQLILSEDSFSLIIQTPNKNHRFIVTSLLRKINVEKSYKKIKPDMVYLYLKKTKEGENWGCLTTTEKRLKESKTKMFDKNDDDGSGDPGNQLMNMMKKMYETGDPEMKRTIAKAWTEGQNKQRDFPM
ncbi:calcyclin-binding protein [Chironomus tepperi]|uniref:calcyclin-binding protein n=1 Tax=Chironomus tepperi TaxID=113505 RepID=UPI00391F2F91